MSALYGFLQRQSQPVDVRNLEAMQQALSYWSADKEQSWINGPIAMGQKLLFNTPESHFETFPRKQRHVVICMDARLDNREELIRQLDIRPSESSAIITDSDIILAAYAQWGEYCAEHLLGDFAFTIWDEVKKQLFCARDHVGIKPFYFHLNEKCFVYSSDLRAMVAHAAVSDKLNDIAVADYLKNHAVEEAQMTFFQDVCKLQPGHTMTVSNTAVNTRCYWRIEDSPTVKLKNAQAYALRLRQLMEQAVHDRMRSAYPITSHLSGGLDSSSIAVIAARKLKAHGARLLAFNWVPRPKAIDDSTHYEWANSRIIAEQEGIDYRYVDMNLSDIGEYIRTTNIAYGDSTGFAYEVAVRDAAQQHHSRIILSGWGGDQAASLKGNAFFAEMFCRGRWYCLLKNLAILAKKQARPWRAFLGLCYHRILMPFVPRRYWRFMPFFTAADNNKKFLYPLLEADFFSQCRNFFSQPTAYSQMQGKKTIRREMISMLRSGHLCARVESWSAAAYACQLQYVYPLLDKRILEFMAGVPGRYFIQQGQGRAIFHDAVRPYIGKILNNQSKCDTIRMMRMMELLSTFTNQFCDELAQKEFKTNYIHIAALKRYLRSLDSKTSHAADDVIKMHAIYCLLMVLFCENQFTCALPQEAILV